MSEKKTPIKKVKLNYMSAVSRTPPKARIVLFEGTLLTSQTNKTLSSFIFCSSNKLKYSAILEYPFLLSVGLTL